MWPWGAGRLVTPPPDPELADCEKMSSQCWGGPWGSRALRGRGARCHLLQEVRAEGVEGFVNPIVEGFRFWRGEGCLLGRRIRAGWRESTAGEAVEVPSGMVNKG